MPATTQTKANTKAGQDDYFLPDLCAPLPSLLIILSVELLVLVYVLVVSDFPSFRWTLFSNASLFVQLTALSSAWSLCVSRPLFGKLNLPLATVASLILISFNTLLVSLFVQIYLADIIGVTNSAWWVMRNLLVANILAAMILRYFYMQRQLRVQEQWALKAHLDSLRERMHPHFLFNTLNSIASLISSKPDLAERAVEDLAELLRVSLRDQSDRTTVEDEIQLTLRYLDIEALRLGTRLKVKWNIDETARDAPMPSFIIQPLVENAIKHGISQLSEGGSIQIVIGSSSQQVWLSVMNPIGPGTANNRGNKIAFANIEQRLNVIYGKGVSVQASCENEIYKANIMYPNNKETA